MVMAEAPQVKDEDVVLLHGRTDDGEGLRGIRSRPGRLEMAEIRPARDGRPIGKAEVVRLRPRPEMPLLCDVEVQYAPGGEAKADSPGTPEHERTKPRSGPPRVASDLYRRNWDLIFGAARRPDPSKLN